MYKKKNAYKKKPLLEYDYPYRNPYEIKTGPGHRVPVDLGFAKNINEAKKNAREYTNKTGRNTYISKNCCIIKRGGKR